VNRFLAYLGQESGASAAEYALILTLVAIPIIAGLSLVGSAINSSLALSASSM
jgi:Flp pilus assembly pilin Flp